MFLPSLSAGLFLIDIKMYVPFKSRIKGRLGDELSVFKSRVQSVTSAVLEQSEMHEKRLSKDELEDFTAIWDEAQNNLRRNKPTIVITECKSVGTSPTFSHRSSSASSESSQSDEEVEAEISLRTDEEEYKMGMGILIRTRTLDEKDGGGDTESVTLIRVTNVDVGSFAHGFGVKKGDFITKINGQQCGKDDVVIKEAFLSYSSDQLEMEILRNFKNRDTGKSELHKMTISNARRLGGITEEEVEIIHITGSSWSLSNIGTYYGVDTQDALLQFESENFPWIVKSGNKLGLATELSEDEAKTNAMYCIHRYWNQEFDDNEFPVVLEHKASRQCVSLVGNNIELVEPEHGLQNVTDESIIFIKRVPQDSS
ncbi:uncharacterized protein LOC110242051, partial [Exaiptasia diaphana]|uniref:PDZ domain-containing protein n=1 Tax=Exaiptasia diaphana TaxID=2652724 RepID=A0A913XEV8_EXADI